MGLYDYVKGVTLWPETRPGPENTGITTPFEELELVQSQSLSVPGTVLEGKYVQGQVTIKASNCVVRNCYIEGKIDGLTGKISNYYGILATTPAATNVLIEDCTITRMRSACVYGINLTIRRCDLGFTNADITKLIDNCLMEHCWLHHAGASITSHADFLQFTRGTGTTIRWNFFDGPGGTTFEGVYYKNSAMIIGGCNTGESYGWNFYQNWWIGGQGNGINIGTKQTVRFSSAVTAVDTGSQTITVSPTTVAAKVTTIKRNARVKFRTDGSLPAGLSPDIMYCVGESISPTQFKIYTKAIDIGGVPVTVTNAGTGNLIADIYSPTPRLMRVEDNLFLRGFRGISGSGLTPEMNSVVAGNRWEDTLELTSHNYGDQTGYLPPPTFGAVYAPTVTPASGDYESSQQITFTNATENALSYYTVDGSTPTSESTLYVGPLTFSTDTSVKVRSYRNDLDPSPVVERVYTIKTDGTPAAPVSLSLSAL